MFAPLGSIVSADSMDVQLGKQAVKFPSKTLEELRPCNDILADAEELRKELNNKGYLFVKNFHKRSDVLNARTAVLKHIEKQGLNILDTANHVLEDGVLNQRCGLGCVPFMEGKNEITHREEMMKVLEGEHVYRFFEMLFGESAKTFDYKWLRAMHRNGYTGAHVDRVYMSRGSQDLLTMWTPLGDITANMGVLAVCEGSHAQDGFKRFQETYAMCDLEAEGVIGTGWFTEDPDEISRIGGTWKTANFHAGDVIIFNMRLVHMSTANLTDLVRLSCDTRWQPKSHEVDKRFVGEFNRIPAATFGVYGKQTNVASSATIDDLKKAWGYFNSSAKK